MENYPQLSFIPQTYFILSAPLLVYSPTTNINSLPRRCWCPHQRQTLTPLRAVVGVPTNDKH